MTQEPDTKPGLYYVTARDDGGRVSYLAGPFENDHQRALELVRVAIDAAYEIDPRAPWYSYGTARMEADPLLAPAGRLNKKLGL